MKVDALNVKNFMGIKKAVIRSERRLVIIGGKNAQGKSSILNAIRAALEGKKQICSEPLRRGEENGYIEMEAGDFMITRTFRDDGKTEVKVKTKDGGKFGQARLSSMLSSIGPDPIAFLYSKPAEQVKIAKDALGLDFTELDAERKFVFEGRTEKNRDVSRLEAQLAGMEFFEDAPSQEVSVSELFEELQEAQRHNAEADSLRDRISRTENEVETLIETVERLRRELSDAEMAVAGKIKSLESLQQELSSFESKDTVALEESMRTAEETNSMVRKNRARAQVEGELAEAQQASDDLTNSISKIDEMKSEMIASAKFPIKGLLIEDGHLLFDGLPFEQASSAQRIRISVAMSLAMNPELRVLMVRDGSLLDNDNLKMLDELAEEMDAQIWVERVGEDDEGAIVIVDGEVAQKQTA